MTLKQNFRAVIEDAKDGGAYVAIPFDVEQVYGQKRVKIKATIDGVPYRGLLVRMGSPCHILGVRKEIRFKIGKDIGDEVQVVEEDTEPRVATIPDDLQQALGSNPPAAASFAKLSYTHQKEYVEWIESAKCEQTRLSRITQTIERLEQGKRGV